MKKYLAVAVILLFIGLAVAPSINANVSKEALVEFTTEVCGLNGDKQTVKLTQKEAEEVEALYKSIMERLNKTKSREEAEEIFKEAVVELDKYGLLGGLSVEQAQRLVISGYNNPRLMHLYKLFQSRLTQKLDENENLFCFVTGKVNGLDFLIGSIPFIILSYLVINLFFLGPFIVPFAVIFMFIDLFNPFCIGRTIMSLSKYEWLNGNIISYGLNGMKSWNNHIRGGLKYVEESFWAIGFIGIKLQFASGYENMTSLFLGFSLFFSVEEKL